MEMLQELNKFGGIIGGANNDSSIKYCYNRGNITANSNYGAAGICATFGHGTEGTKGELLGCYNTGKIEGKVRNVAGITGYMNNITKVENVVNCGEVYLSTSKATTDIGSSSTYLGRIIGKKGTGELNNYRNVDRSILQGYSESELATALGDAYTSDVKIKVKDETTGEEKEVWKYNNGYPILKWQIGE